MQVNLTANGVSDPVHWYGGPGIFTAWGNFGGGTLKLETSPDGGTTWIAVDRPGDTYTTLTANGEGAFELGVCLIRANLTGATNPSVWCSL